VDGVAQSRPASLGMYYLARWQKRNPFLMF
jgi:hypothetical protein